MSPSGCFAKPKVCDGIEWYQSQPYECVNCIDRYLFDIFYRPSLEEVEVDGKKVFRRSATDITVKRFQYVADVVMEALQIQLFRLLLIYFSARRVWKVAFSSADVEDPRGRSAGIMSSTVNFGNALFPRLMFSTLVSYVLEALVKFNFFRKRPNMTRGAVATSDRFMGTDEMQQKEESYEMWNASKGHIVGFKSHRSSFPSGHNMGAWSLFGTVLLSFFATDLKLAYTRPGIVIKALLFVSFILGMYQVYARISLGGWHWPSDVMAGVTLGLLSSLLGMFIYQLFRAAGFGPFVLASMIQSTPQLILLVGYAMGFSFGDEFINAAGYSLMPRKTNMCQVQNDRSIFTTGEGGLVQTNEEIRKYWKASDLMKKAEARGDEKALESLRKDVERYKPIPGTAWSRAVIEQTIVIRNQDVIIDAFLNRGAHVDCLVHPIPKTCTTLYPFRMASTAEPSGKLEPGMLHTTGKGFHENLDEVCKPENMEPSKTSLEKYHRKDPLAPKAEDEGNTFTIRDSVTDEIRKIKVRDEEEEEDKLSLGDYLEFFREWGSTILLALTPMIGTVVINLSLNFIETARYRSQLIRDGLLDGKKTGKRAAGK